jgi:hypothetical protein
VACPSPGSSGRFGSAIRRSDRRAAPKELAMQIPPTAVVVRGAAVVALAALVVASASAQSAADKPAFNVGDSWIYTLTTDTGKDAKEVTYARKVVAASPEGADVQIGERIQKLDAAGNLLDARGPEFNRTLYKFPMQVGSEWTYAAKFGTQFPIEQRGGFKVIAYEPLTVPAGTFDCYRVEGKSEAVYKASFQQQLKETYWYCPKVNGIAKMLRETSTTARDTPSSREKTEQVLVRYVPRG